MCTNKKPVIILLSLLTLTAISCVKSSGLEDCIERMRIEIRWILTQPVDYNGSVQIEVIPHTSESEFAITSDVYGVDVDLRVGEYTIVGYETAADAQIDIEHQTVSVPVAADGLAFSSGIFSAGSTRANVTLTGSDLVIPLPMHRQVRPLVIEIETEGGGSPLIQNITGVLHGIALERSIDNGFPPVNGQNRPAAISSGSIGFNFSTLTRASYDNWFGDTKNLLGIDGSTNQVLDLTITFDDGRTTSLSLDVTDDLSEFQTLDINEPWYILITLEAGINLEITIADWITGPESWVTAH